MFSVGAKDGTPLKVENLLDARLEETWTSVSQPIPNTPDAHRIDVRGRCSTRGCSKRFIEKKADAYAGCHYRPRRFERIAHCDQCFTRQIIVC